MARTEHLRSLILRPSLHTNPDTARDASWSRDHSNARIADSTLHSGQTNTLAKHTANVRLRGTGCRLSNCIHVHLLFLRGLITPLSVAYTIHPPPVVCSCRCDTYRRQEGDES